jgi:hypothetical protein
MAVRAGICLECLEYVTRLGATIHFDAPNDIQFTDTAGVRHRILPSGRGINAKASFAKAEKEVTKDEDQSGTNDGTTEAAE